ncbi:sensor histidine kinase [Streptomyces gulbargensis]
MRTPRRPQDAGATPPTPATAAARGRRAHAGQPAEEPRERPTGDRRSPESPTGPEPLAGPRAPWLPRLLPRPRTVRAKIVSLLMVPVVSLLALWGFATVTTAQDVAHLRRLQRADAEIREPVTAALTALQTERRAALHQAAAPTPARAADLKERIRHTDEAVDRLRLDATHTVADTGHLPGDLAARVNGFVGSVEGLTRLRAAAVAGHARVDQVHTAYTDTVSAAFAVHGALTGMQDARQGTQARVLLELGRAGEMLAREDALLGAARLTDRLPPEHLRAFAGAAETRRTLTASATTDLPAAERGAWERFAAGGELAVLTRAEDRILAAAPDRPAARAVPPAEWDAAVTAVRGGLAAVESDARAAAADRTDPFTGGALTTGGAAVVLGLVAVASSLVISVRIGRGLVVELVGLRNTALGIARRELPAAMRRLRAGEEIDIRTEAPPGPVSPDEIGQVHEALTTVHRAALEAAVERAELADGISGVFVNLARRSQVLVHRQLNLLDSMERRVDDPNELGDLFRLDHLTTRMRRHAESLIILSGAAPGRAWRMPVPLTDVVRAAVSEIEDYARVEVRRLPGTAITGGAVADLTHLLAELIENATQFSPPHTKVRVSGEPVGNGYALEIEDRGLGMGSESLAEANARIARSEALDLFDSDRLGLFVVSRLSARHDIRVHLRTSPYGGTTAVVLLPTDLLQSAPPEGVDTPRAVGGLVPGPEGPAGSHAGTRTDHGGDEKGDGGTGQARRAAQEEAEARRAEARRFARAQDPPPPTGTSGPTPPRTGPRPLPRPAPLPAPPAPEPASPRRARPTAPAGVTALRRPGASATAPDERPAAPSAPTDAGTELPRRVRQASLVPQLRKTPAPAPASPATVALERTPEQVRERMTAYHDGWRRGGGPTPGSRRPPGAAPEQYDSPRPGPYESPAAGTHSEPATAPYTGTPSDPYEGFAPDAHRSAASAPGDGRAPGPDTPADHGRATARTSARPSRSARPEGDDA